MAKSKEEKNMIDALKKKGYTVLDPDVFGIRGLTHSDVKEAAEALELHLTKSDLDNLDYKAFDKDFSGDYSEYGQDERNELIEDMIRDYMKKKTAQVFDAATSGMLSTYPCLHTFTISFVCFDGRKINCTFSDKTILSLRRQWMRECNNTDNFATKLSIIDNGPIIKEKA